MYSKLNAKLVTSEMESLGLPQASITYDSDTISHDALYDTYLVLPSGTTHSVTIDDIAAGSTCYGVLVENRGTANKIIVGGTDSNGTFLKTVNYDGSGEFNLLLLGDLDTSVALTVVCADAADCAVKITIICS